MSQPRIYYAPRSKWFKRFLKATSLRKLGFILLLLVMLVMGAVWGKKNHIYGRWKQKRLIEAAHNFEKKQDFKNASLSARKLLKDNPQNLEAIRIMARISDLYKRPEALIWWQRAVMLSPISQDRYSLAEAAIRAGNYRMAEKAIEALPEESRDDVAYHKIASMISFYTGDLKVAERHAQALMTLDPDREENTLRMALIQLVSTNDSSISQARTTLQKMSQTSGSHKLDALRTLLSDAFKHRDGKRAVQEGERLYRESGATQEDKLLYLQSLIVTRNENVTNVLSEIQASAATNVLAAFNLVRWLNRFGLVSQSLAWTSTLGDEMQKHSLILMGRAESYLAARDWKNFDEWLGRTDWKDLNYMKLAFQGISTFQLKNAGYDEKWKQAVDACERKSDRLIVLGKLGIKWGLVKEGIQIYWTLSNDPKQRKQAFSVLSRLYKIQNDTLGLYRVSERKRHLDLKDSANNNNFALLSLLLNTNVSLAYDLARESYLAQPTNHNITSTYAFALHHEGKGGRGLKLLEGFSEERLNDPTIAAYYGILLAEVGQSNLAKRYLQVAIKGDLLPEEQTLLKQARAKAGLDK